MKKIHYLKENKILSSTRPRKGWVELIECLMKYKRTGDLDEMIRILCPSEQNRKLIRLEILLT